MNTLKKLLLLLIVITSAEAASAQTLPIFQYKKLSQPKNPTDANGKRINLAKTIGKTDSSKNNDVQDKIDYTLKQLAPSDTSDGHFSIFHANRYNIDTVNEYIYNQGFVSALQSASIQNLNGIHTVVTAEVASFMFGPVRLGLGGLFQSTGDSTKDNAIKSSLQKIVSNGGSITMNFLLPMYFYRSAKDQTHFAVFAQSRFAFNNIDTASANSGSVSSSTNMGYTNQTGFTIHFDAGSNDSKARLSFDVPLFYSASTNNVNSQLGLPNFFMAKIEIGAVLGSLLKFDVSGPLYSTCSKVQHTPFLFSLQFSPSQLIKAQ